MDSKIKSRMNSVAIKSKIYELALAFVKFSVLNLTANLKGKQVKFKEANLT